MNTCKGGKRIMDREFKYRPGKSRLPLAVLCAAALMFAGNVFVQAVEKEKHAENAQEKGREKAEGKEKAEESRVKRLPNGDVVITLEEEDQKRIGLTLEHLKAATLAPEIRAFGRVIDPAPLAALFNELAVADATAKASRQDLENAKKAREAELAAAEAAAKASHQDLERVKVLQAQDNASLRALQTAEAMAKRDELQVISQKIAGARALQTAEVGVQRDQLALDNVHGRLLLAWGKTIMQQPDLGAFLRALIGQESALVRLEIPAGESLKDLPKTARVASLNGELNWLNGDSLGFSPIVDPQTQGQGYLYLVRTGAGQLAPGTAVTGYLKKAGEPLAGVVIPRAAIIRADGGAWIYVEVGEEKFSRKRVELDHPVDAGWFITGGLTEKDEVVMTGAQVLLSEEMKALNKGGE